MIPRRRAFVPPKRNVRRLHFGHLCFERFALLAVLLIGTCLFVGNLTLLREEYMSRGSGRVLFELSVGGALSHDRVWLERAPHTPYNRLEDSRQNVQADGGRAKVRRDQTWPTSENTNGEDLLAVNQRSERPMVVRDSSCGMTAVCVAGALPMRLVSAGRGETPRACVNGQETLTEKNAGRGVAVVELSLPGVLVAVNTFDVASGVSELQNYLYSVQSGHLLLFVTADGAFEEVSDEARLLLHSIGSGYAYRLASGRGWVMVTVKGLAFSTLFERLAEPASNGGWSEPAELSACVPLQMSEHSTGYQSRMEFCEQYNKAEPSDYGSFCSAKGVRESLLPKPLTGSQLAEKDKFLAQELPVAILARHDRPAYLQKCLHSFNAQPGLNTSLLTVFFDGNSTESHAVANFYGVRSVFFEKTISHSTMKAVFRRADMITAHYARVLPLVLKMFNTANEVIVIEEDHVVSPDFLFFFSQLLPVLRADSSLLTISAYNDNGYKHAAQDGGAVYRTEFFPGRAWLLQRRVWNEWKDTFPKCCSGWSWDLWIRERLQQNGGETLMPDIPRVHHIGKIGLQVNGDYWEKYFKPAILNAHGVSSLRDVEQLSSSAYEDYLDRLIRTAVLINGKGKKCSPELIPETFGMRYVIYFQQSSISDFTHIMHLVKCFHLWDLGVRGLHRGLFRFYCKYNHVMLIGSKTRYAELHMPQEHTPFAVNL